MLSIEVDELPDDKDRVIGLSDNVSPDGDEIALRLTSPRKPSWLVRVRVVFAEDPLTMLREVGVALIPKLGTKTETVMLALSKIVYIPLDPKTARA